MVVSGGLDRLARPSDRLSAGGGVAEELVDVVGRADEVPFGGHRVDSTPDETPVTGSVFDLPEDGLDGDGAFRVELGALLGAQPVFHGVERTQLRRRFAVGGAELSGGFA